MITLSPSSNDSQHGNGNGDSPSEASATESNKGGTHALPTFAFGKHLPLVIERIKTEIAGARFVEKISNKQQLKKKQNQTSQETDPKLDINDVLNPRKRRKGGAAKAKAKARPTNTRDGGEEEGQAEIESTVTVGAADYAVERARWWIDDLLGCVVHSAGGVLSSSCGVSSHFQLLTSKSSKVKI